MQQSFEIRIGKLRRRKYTLHHLLLDAGFAGVHYSNSEIKR